MSSEDEKKDLKSSTVEEKKISVHGVVTVKEADMESVVRRHIQLNNSNGVKHGLKLKHGFEYAEIIGYNCFISNCNKLLVFSQCPYGLGYRMICQEHMDQIIYHKEMMYELHNKMINPKKVCIIFTCV